MTHSLVKNDIIERFVKIFCIKIDYRSLLEYCVLRERKDRILWNIYRSLLLNTARSS